MLNSGDHVVTAFGERAPGPGWANSLLCIVVRGEDGTLRIEYRQPADQSSEMQVLFGLANAAHRAMVHAVERWRSAKRRKQR